MLKASIVVLVAVTGITVAASAQKGFPVLKKKATVSKPVWEGCKDGKENEQCISEFVTEHIEYPDADAENGNEGRAVVRFVISKKGTIMEPEIVRSSGFKTFDKEVLKVVASMKSWKPATVNHHPVPYTYMLPVTFRLDETD